MDLLGLTVGEAIAKCVSNPVLREEALLSLQMAFSSFDPYIGASTNGYQDLSYLFFGVENPKSTIYVFAGGCYQAVAGWVEGLPIAKELNDLGYSVIVMDYPLAERAKYPFPRDFAIEKIRETRRDIPMDKMGVKSITSSFSIMGFSAAGHLAGVLAAKMSRMAGFESDLKTVCLSYPVITMNGETHPLTKLNCLGLRDSDYDPSFAHEASVENQVHEHYPPTFVWGPIYDPCVPSNNMDAVAESLSKNCIIHQIRRYPVIGHGFGRGLKTHCRGWIRDYVSFLESAVSAKTDENCAD